MKKYILIIVILVVIVVALGLAYYFLRPEPEDNVPNGNNEEKPDYLVYADEKWDFEISYPTNWKEEKLQGEGLIAFEIKAPKEESGISEATFLVFAFNPSSGQVFEDEIQKTINQLEAKDSLIFSSKETISDANAYKLVYIYYDDFSGRNIKQQHYFIDKRESWYQILYTAKEEVFDKYVSDIEQMVGSFRVTK